MCLSCGFIPHRQVRAIHSLSQRALPRKSQKTHPERSQIDNSAWARGGGMSEHQQLRTFVVRLNEEKGPEDGAAQLVVLKAVSMYMFQ